MEAYDHPVARALLDWIPKLENVQPPPVPRDPEKFITKVLGYELTDFHYNWWRFAAQHRQSLLLAPRGHGKSTILTVSFTLFTILRDPETRVLIISNTAAQAQAFLREIRQHLESNPNLLDAWGNLRASPWTSSEFVLNLRERHPKEATVTGMGVMGPVISRHYDVILLDDVVDEEAASSKRIRDKMWTWYYKELMPTLEPDGEIHILGTRYHHDDLYGKLIEAGMPVMVERAIQEKDGLEHALWEDRFSLELLRERKAQAGPAIFNAQYQNDVTAMRGRVFRQEWISFEPRPAPVRLYQGVDLAIGTGDQHDYFAHVTVAENIPGHFRVVGAFRARLSFEEQYRIVTTFHALHDRPEAPVVIIGVEANAYQEALAQRLRNEAGLPVKSIKQTRDKFSRAMNMQGLFETGRITFEQMDPTRRSTALMNDLIEELLAFPDSDHDDMVDALQIALYLAAQSRRYLELPVAAPDVGPE